MTNREYEAAREPTRIEYRIRSRFLELGRSVPKTAHEFGIERVEVIRAVMAVRDFRLDSGWSRRYAEAVRTGFSLADATLHADMEAAYFLKQRNEE